MHLGLKPSKISRIQSDNPNNSARALQEVVVEWVRQNYDVQKFGPPSWKMVVKAVAADTGGRNKLLAKKIANKHPKSLGKHKS